MVYFVTEREAGTGKVRFLGARDSHSITHYGAVLVAVPVDPKASHRPKLFREVFSSSAAPPAHLQETTLTYSSDTAMYAALERQIVNTQARNAALIYVHGFNDGFDEEVWRSAKLASDTGFSGASVLYDWPSANETLRYSADRYSMEVSTVALANFLADFSNRTRGAEINLVAHSMGCWGLLTALEYLNLQNKLPKINQIMLAAPDIGEERFMQLAPGLAASGKITHITVYASKNDWAMKVSKDISKLTLPPIGGLVPPIDIVTGIDMIDTSSVSPDLIDHDYFVASTQVVHDIGLVLQNEPAPRDGLKKSASGGITYYQVLP